MKYLGYFLLCGILIAIIVKWYLWGGLGGAIFIGLILFFISLFIFTIAGAYSKKASKSETYIEADDDGVKNIEAQVPTAIISRSNGKDTEHVILSKHSQLPQKITYE